MKPFDHRSGDCLRCGSAEIYAESTGNPGSPVLMLLHGGFGTLEDFNGFVAGFERDFEIVGIDSRGQGRSTLGDEPLTYALLQDDVERVLAARGVDRASIIGVSDGGIVAYRLAIQSPPLVERLVTVSSRWHRRQAERTRSTFVETTGASQRREHPETFDDYQRLNPDRDFDRLTEALVAMWLDPAPTGHPDDAVATIACPLLIVHGDDDALLTREAVVELAGRVAGSHLLNIPFATHPAFREQPELFALAVDRFLERR